MIIKVVPGFALIAPVIALAIAVPGFDGQGEKADGARERGRKLLLAALEKRGGKKALDSIRDYTLELQATQWVSVDAERRAYSSSATRKVLLGKVPCFEDLYLRKLGKNREDRRKIVLVGRTGRVQTALSGHTLDPVSVTDQWASYHRSELEILRAPFVKGTTIEYVSSKKIKGKETDDVVVKRPDEAPVRVTIERDTGRFLAIAWKPLRRERSGAPPATWSIAFSDFRDFGPVKGVAWQAAVSRAGTLLAKRVTASVKINTGLKPEDF